MVEAHGCVSRSRLVRLLPPMNSVERHPALILGVLGAASGVLGAVWLSEAAVEAVSARMSSALAGLSFGCVIGYAVWRWGARSLFASVTALIGVFVGWQAAVNAGVQLETNWLPGAVASDLKSYVAGAAAGAIGGLATWAAAAVGLAALRQWQTSIVIVAAGALLGLLLPLTNNIDNPLVLLAPWQAGVAALIGWRLGSQSIRADRAMAADAESA